MNTIVLINFRFHSNPVLRSNEGGFKIEYSTFKHGSKGKYQQQIGNNNATSISCHEMLCIVFKWNCQLEDTIFIVDYS